jgi:peptidyl-tRNA hydrolase, PTH2 family
MLKQYVIIPKSLKMSPGKIASQVAHATFMALENQRETVQYAYEREVIAKWKHTGMCVIVLQCKDVAALRDAKDYLQVWNVPHHLYIDEGYTEVPALTPTALATGVLPEDKHWMLAKFKFYK